MKRIKTAILLASISASASLATAVHVFGDDTAMKVFGELAINPDDVKLGARHYSPFVDQSYPNLVFWGDTHLHTSCSTDAGMIGSTDSHTSLATARDDNLFGKATLAEPGGGDERYEEFNIQPDFKGEEIAIRHYESLASGLAAAWARENNREAIWDVFNRK